MSNNPSIYEINTRVWLRRFDTNGRKARLGDVPEEYWDTLNILGMDYVWLMGVWLTNPETIEKYCFEDFLRKEYSAALKDWKPEDVIGSPYSIDSYTLNPLLGDEAGLLKIKSDLNARGMGLILDFIPNHFSADSSLIRKRPNLFLCSTEEYLKADPHTYFKPEGTDLIFAHGRDPFFPAWQDTIQLNYFCGETRAFMKDTLLDLTGICDGVRCDMAMLIMNNIFDNTWGAVLDNGKYEKPAEEFWEYAIKEVKKERKDFLFIGEAYWDLEWELQQLGFDYTYDKRLTDRLKSDDVLSISGHLSAEHEYQMHSVRFIENHDETRSLKSLGKEKAFAAAVIISTIKGMRFYFDGQLDGKKIKLPLQLGREPFEPRKENVFAFYAKLLSITSDEVFKNGNWEPLTPLPSWERDRSYRNILAWLWEYNNEKRLVAVNYGQSNSSCRIRLDVSNYNELIKFEDLLNDEIYYRDKEEILDSGLYIELKGYYSHIFYY